VDPLTNIVAQRTSFCVPSQLEQAQGHDRMYQNAVGHRILPVSALGAFVSVQMKLIVHSIDEIP
jgi:hypothetical protein